MLHMLGGFGDDLLRDVAGDGVVTREGHFKAALAAGDRAQFGREAEEFGQRCFGCDELHAVLKVNTQHAAALMGEFAIDGTHEGFRDVDGERHDRFEQHGLGFGDCITQGAGTGNLEGNFRGVDIVVGAVVNGDFDVLHQVTCHRTCEYAIVHAFLYGGDEVAGDCTADHSVVEHFFAFLQWRYAEINFTELSASAALFFVAVVPFAIGGYRFAIGHLGRADVNGDVGLGLHDMHGYIDLDVTHAFEDDLLGLDALLNFKRGIGLADAMEGDAHFIFVSLRVCRDGDPCGRLGEVGARETRRATGGDERMAGSDVLEFGNSDDVAGDGLFNGDLLFADELEHRTDRLLAAVGGVDDFHGSFESAAHDSDEVEVSEVGVDHAAPDVTDEGSRGISRMNVSIHIGEVAAAGRRHEAADIVEQFINANVLEGVDGKDGMASAGDDGFVKTLGNFGCGENLAVEVFLGERIVSLGGVFDEFAFDFLEGLGEFVGFEDVDDAAFAVGNDDGRAGGAEAVAALFDDFIEVGVFFVEPGDDEADGADAVLFAGLPDAQGAGLDAGDGVNRDECEVARAGGADDLSVEIAKAGGVDEDHPELFVVVEEGCVEAAGEEGRFAFFFFVGEIADAGAVRDGAEFVIQFELVGEGIDKCGLAGAGMPQDREIAYSGNRKLFHRIPFERN